MATEAQAIETFGEQRFLSADRVVSAWNGLIRERRGGRTVPDLDPPGNPPLRYTEETLHTLAKDPAWYLVYDPGLSLRENLAIFGTDPQRQPCHLEGNDWWLGEREDAWATNRTEPGYYLVRMEGLFQLDNPARDWDWQEEQIGQMGESFYRTPTHLVVNACMSCFLLNRERYFESYHNFGPETDADYCLVVTKFDEKGLNLGHWLRNDWGGYWGADLRVSVTRTFDS